MTGTNTLAYFVHLQRRRKNVYLTLTSADRHPEAPLHHPQQAAVQRPGGQDRCTTSGALCPGVSVIKLFTAVIH